MQCPKDGTTLETRNYLGIEVDACPTCNGMWLDQDELDQLEDQAYDQDAWKGSLMLDSSPTEYKCPHCGNQLRVFRYRMYHSLEIDYCDQGHGFWLDENEEQRVLQLMETRKGDIDRKVEAESAWAGFLKKFRSRSFGTPA